MVASFLLFQFQLRLFKHSFLIRFSEVSLHAAYCRIAIQLHSDQGVVLGKVAPAPTLFAFLDLSQWSQAPFGQGRR